MTSIRSDATVSIRALMRDTALHVALLAQRAAPDAIDVLRRDCLRLITEFEAALQYREVPVDISIDALYAQCALLDETVLRCLPDDKKPEWDAAPLQVERFQNHDAGERVYERIAVRMRDASPPIELLECYSTVLGLGFKGRYARSGEAERTTLIAELDARIAALRPPPEQGLIIEAPGAGGRDWLHRLSPWVLAGIAAAAAAALHLLLGQALDLQLSDLLQKKL